MHHLTDCSLRRLAYWSMVEIAASPKGRPLGESNSDQSLSVSPVDGHSAPLQNLTGIMAASILKGCFLESAVLLPTLFLLYLAPIIAFCLTVGRAHAALLAA